MITAARISSITILFTICALVGRTRAGNASDPYLAKQICDNHPEICANGGLCVAAEDDSSSGPIACICFQGFEGERCEKPINYCQRNDEYCLNGGECDYDLEQGTGCRCLEGFGGLRCDYVFDLCKGGYCLHGGICSHNGICFCRDGYIGKRCEKRVPFRSQYNSSGCPISEHCRMVYRDGICDEECNIPSCFSDGFDCDMTNYEMHKYLKKCATAFRKGFDFDKEQRTPDDQASTQYLQGPFSLFVSACVLLLLIILLVTGFINRWKKNKERPTEILP